MFNKFSDRIYIQPPEHFTDRPNIGLIIGDKYTLLFEAGNSAENVELLKGRLLADNLPQPDFIAISHWHWDHSFGMDAWNLPTIAGEKTNEYLKKASGWKWDDESMTGRVQTGEDIVFCNEMIKREYPDRDKIKVIPADITFNDCMTIDLGGIECQLVHVAGPHADDSVVCYIPSEKFVFLGDSNGKDLYGQPWHFDIEHEDDFMEETGKIPYDMKKVNAYLALLDKLDFTHCIGGHADIMTKEQLYKSFE